MEADWTPGRERRRSRIPSSKPARFSSVNAAPWSMTSAMTVWSVEKPLSEVRRWMRLLAKRPVTSRRVVQARTCPPISQRRRWEFLAEPEERPVLCKACRGLMRSKRRVGSTPKRIVAPMVSRTERVSTAGLTEIALVRGRAMCALVLKRCTARFARETPRTPPAMDKRQTSASEVCMRLQAEAPRAERRAASRSRAADRASCALARLTQAMSRTLSTAANKSHRLRVVLPTMASLRGWT